MEWDAEMKWKRQSLLRLAFMLFSLAAHAERAALASSAVRRELLAALRPGARSAQTFVLDAALEFGVQPDPEAFDPFDENAFFHGDAPGAKDPRPELQNPAVSPRRGSLRCLLLASLSA